MYAFIYKKDEIVILNKEKFEIEKIDLKITCGNEKIGYTDISVIKEFLNEEWWHRHTVTLASDLDITKQYKIAVNGESADLDISQYYKTKEFRDLYSYTGNDLGCVLTETETVFKVWSPVATSIVLKLYNDNTTTNCITFDLQKGESGIFYYRHEGNLKGMYYNFDVTCFGETKEGIDIYAKAVSTNGLRAVVVDLEETNPDGFKSHTFENPDSITDTIIYEVHVRDLSMNENSNIQNKGKFLGFTERGTKNSFGQATGIDHILELGATHVHLLPSFDYKSVDESKLEDNQFNWGYDPQNYNVPEGSYSTNPEDAKVRINEMKQAVMAMHKAGLGVIMDVVYNHTYDTMISNHEKFVPGYYYRTDSLGVRTDGSGCGNETASERYMVRKHFVDSLVYWAKEYKIDGFRFDLMGLHDVDTMNLIRASLDKVNTNIIMYGEGWCGGHTSLPEEKRATKSNAKKTNVRIAYFSDDIRDAVKGDVFVDEVPGFVNGSLNDLERIKFGVVGSVEHKEVKITKENNLTDFWAYEPTQTVTYCSAHDNLSLYDKLLKVSPSVSDEEIIQMNKLSAFITHISQGALFYQAGEEMARTKGGDENSYKSPDNVNSIDWNRKEEYNTLFNYYKGLAQLRKSDKVFRLTNSREVNKRISFGNCKEQFLVVNFLPKNKKYSKYVAIVNAQSEEEFYDLEDDAIYKVLVNGEVAGTEEIDVVMGKLVVPPKTAIFLAKESSYAKELEFVKDNVKPIVIATGVTIGTVILSKVFKRKK